ncbi:ROK family protein [Candidatus Woesearchaeota archaeon]|jgi:glucokinase|nr:ROK family protein [Candidatus Woesearchaeota archaeon]MBT3537329.1 ROK family protein [Candidatus Woesearchaeota archaeon]MBT4697401.1 ROK family protein [Candidatus Woesearchaeota archaeon]MBT4716705.1 ROK family protein [Candidatus Woesearchaeota archaeon]MBT7106361.1 ROK family protein [Candidatus Woesearchaeota archaeon]
MYVKDVAVNKEEISNFNDFVLAADVGGTNSKFAVYGDNVKKIFSFEIKSSEIKDVVNTIKDVIKFAKEEFSLTIDSGCISAAGPVSGRRINLTNSPLNVDVDRVFSETGLIKVGLINDFEAVGYGLSFVEDCDLEKINSAKPVEDESQAYIGAGTGLGQGLLVFNGERRVPLASEGGHCSFCAIDEYDWDMKTFIEKQVNHEVDYDLMVSGRGLVHMFNFAVYNLADNGEYEIREEIEKENVDKGTLITKYGVNGDDEYCKKAVDYFVKHYARAIRHLALSVLPFGGMYIAGGIAPNMVDRLKKNDFLEEFENHYAQKSLLNKIPLYVVKDTNIGLKGAANVAFNFKEKLLKK